MLLATFLSPVLMVIVATLVVVMVKYHSIPKATPGVLIVMSIALSIAGAIASLIFTIGWMTWYEKATGYSAGNAPLGWLFFFGPLSMALGQLLALLIWWFKKPGGNRGAA